MITRKTGLQTVLSTYITGPIVHVHGVGVVHALMSLYLKTDHDPNSSSRATRRSSVAASVVWEALKRKKAQRGSPKAKCDFLWESCTIDSN